MRFSVLSFFFFNDTATTEIYTLSLHDALPIPHLPGAQATFLNSISCTSGFACTAVAGVVSASGRLVTMAERWNGTRWRIQPTPNPAGTRGAELSGVACTGPSACTAVGAAVD